MSFTPSRKKKKGEIWNGVGKFPIFPLTGDIPGRFPPVVTGPLVFYTFALTNGLFCGKIGPVEPHFLFIVN
jgi:hypothetical protein